MRLTVDDRPDDFLADAERGEAVTRRLLSARGAETPDWIAEAARAPGS